MTRKETLGSLPRMKSQVFTCIFLFLFVLLSQKLVSIIAPRDGNFNKYITAAKLYAQSKLDPERVTDFSPFYFDLNLALYRWFGSYDDLLVTLQVAAVGLSVLLFYGIASRHFSQGTAVVAAMAFCLSSNFLVLAQIFVPDVWFLTFLLTGIWFLTGNRNASILLLILSASFFGLAFFTRPTALLYIPFTLLGICYSHRKVVLLAASSFLLVFLAFLFLLIFRNHHYTRETTLLVMDPGGVFFEGNNPYSDGNGVSTPLVKDLEGQYMDQPSYAQALLKRIPAAVSGRKMDTDESNKYWQSKALHYLEDHPGAGARLMLRKIHRLFQTKEVHDVLPALVVSTALKENFFPLVPTSVLTVFALLGMYLKRAEWRQLSIFWGGFLIGCVVPLIYFVSIRYRLPLTPFLLFFSCAAAEYLIAELRGGRWRKLLILAFAGGSLIVALDWQAEDGNGPDDVWISIKRALHLQSSAANLRNAGKRNLASENVSAAVAAAPFLHEGLILANLPYPAGGPLQRAIPIKINSCKTEPSRSCYFDLGLLFLYAGKIPEAKKIFQTLASSGEVFHRWYFCSPYPEYYLGRIAGGSEHNWNEAIHHFQNVLRLHPGEPETLAALTVAFEKTGQPQQADSCRRGLFRYYDDADAMFLLGKHYWNAGDFQKSTNSFLQVLQWLPDYRKARIYAAASLGSLGRTDEAAREYWKASAIKEEPLLFQQVILEIFQANADSHQTAQSFFAYGVVLRRNGRFQEAHKMQLLAVQLQPDFRAAKVELKSLSTALLADKGSILQK